MVKWATLRPIHEDKVAKTGDAENGVLIAEGCLKVVNEAGIGVPQRQPRLGPQRLAITQTISRTDADPTRSRLAHRHPCVVEKPYPLAHYFSSR